MYIGQIIKADCANGQGIRLSVFVSGCTNCCKGCFQPQTWDFEYGEYYDDAMEQFIVDELSKEFYQGLTVLGGEPFELRNQKTVLRLIKRVREALPDKDIWMYTGYTYETDLQEGGSRFTEVTDEILDHIDILIDGKFEEDLKNITLKFRGSENQRIIDMKKTRRAGVVVHSQNI